MEILTAYIRESSPWPHRAASTPLDAHARWTHECSVREAAEQAKSDDEKPSPRADIQAILTVLRRRSHIAEEIESGFYVHLHGSDLSGTDLGTDLRKEGAASKGQLRGI